jgi:hypothetical protein
MKNGYLFHVYGIYMCIPPTWKLFRLTEFVTKDRSFLLL